MDQKNKFISLLDLQKILVGKTIKKVEIFEPECDFKIIFTDNSYFAGSEVGDDMSYIDLAYFDKEC